MKQSHLVDAVVQVIHQLSTFNPPTAAWRSRPEANSLSHTIFIQCSYPYRRLIWQLSKIIGACVTYKNHEGCCDELAKLTLQPQLSWRGKR